MEIRITLPMMTAEPNGTSACGPNGRGDAFDATMSAANRPPSGDSVPIPGGRKTLLGSADVTSSAEHVTAAPPDGSEARPATTQEIVLPAGEAPEPDTEARAPAPCAAEDWPSDTPSLDSTELAAPPQTSARAPDTFAPGLPLPPTALRPGPRTAEGEASFGGHGNQAGDLAAPVRMIAPVLGMAAKPAQQSGQAAPKDHADPLRNSGTSASPQTVGLAATPDPDPRHGHIARADTNAWQITPALAAKPGEIAAVTPHGAGQLSPDGSHQQASVVPLSASDRTSFAEVTAAGSGPLILNDLASVARETAVAQALRPNTAGSTLSLQTMPWGEGMAPTDSVSAFPFQNETAVSALIAGPYGGTAAEIRSAWNGAVQTVSDGPKSDLLTDWLTEVAEPEEDAGIAKMVVATDGLATPLPASIADRPMADHVPRPPTRQLAEAIAQGSAGPRETELVLAPEELGKVSFAFKQQDGVMTITISADRPETLALFRRNADMLSADLAQSGLGGATLEFGASGRDSGGGRPTWGERAPFAAPTELAEGVPLPPITRRPTGSGRVDLRL